MISFTLPKGKKPWKTTKRTRQLSVFPYCTR